MQQYCVAALSLFAVCLKAGFPSHIYARPKASAAEAGTKQFITLSGANTDLFLSLNNKQQVEMFLVQLLLALDVDTGSELLASFSTSVLRCS